MKALAVSSLKAEHPLPVLLEAAGLARSTSCRERGDAEIACRKAAL